jgi:hypothetical protein
MLADETNQIMANIFRDIQLVITVVMDFRIRYLQSRFAISIELVKILLSFIKRENNQKSSTYVINSMFTKIIKSWRH